MPIEREDTLTSVGIPHLDSAVCRAADDSVAWHLWRPDAAGVSNQCPQALTPTTDNAQYNLPNNTHSGAQHNKLVCYACKNRSQIGQVSAVLKRFL